MVATYAVALGLQDRTIICYCPYLFGPPFYKRLADCATRQSFAKQFPSIVPAKYTRVVTQSLSTARASRRKQIEITWRFLVFRITRIDNLAGQPVKFRLWKGPACCNSPFWVEPVVSR